MKSKHKKLLLLCSVVMLCTVFNSQKSLGIDIVNGETYENFTDAGEFAGFYGGIAVNRKDLKILNNTFLNNKNTHGAVYGIPGGGGVIYDWGGTLTIKDSKFESNSNTASGFSTGGGALMLYQTKSADISGSEFIKNSAYSGGAMYFSKAENVSIKDTTFDGNTASNGGGALYYQNAKNIEISDSNFTGNKVGNINEYNKYGGAIMINGLSITSDSGIKAAIHDTVFENNEANSGGAIYVSSADVLFDNLTFNNNNANSGGAMMVLSGSSLGRGLTLNNSRFTGNTAVDNGGAIYAAGTLNINNSKFSKNTANSGGAIAVTGEEPVIISDSIFKENTAETLGGAVYSHGGTMEIHNSKFDNNHAKTRGGALATLSNTSSSSSLDVVRIINSDFINNKADQDGGAIHVNQLSQSGAYKLFQIVSNDGKTHEFTGNMHKLGKDMGTPESNALYIEEGTVSLITSGEGSKLLFNDGVSGSSIDKAAINIDGNVVFNAPVKNTALTLSQGEIVLNSGSIEANASKNAPILNNVDLNLNSGILNMKNGKIDTLNIRNLTAASEGDVKIAFDADLSSGESDKFNISQQMEGGLKFDAEHFDVNLKDGNNLKFQLFNKVDKNFSLVGDSIVQYTTNQKIVLKLGEDGYINATKVASNGLTDAIAFKGVREYRQNPAADLTINQNLGSMNGEYLKINFDNQELNGGGHEGITVAKGQRLELTNIGSSANGKALTNFATENSGAVVNNAGELTVNNSVIANNKAFVNGGAINNAGVVNIIDTSFIGNQASQDGGAIYNEGGKVTITASSKDIVFSGNMINPAPSPRSRTLAPVPSSNDITMSNTPDNVAHLTFNGPRTTTLNGGIKGEGAIIKEDSGTLNLGGDNSNYIGAVYYNGGITNLMNGASYFNAESNRFNNNAMLNLANNNPTDKVNFGNLFMDGNGRLGVDIDMKTGESDMFAANTVKGDGKLILDNINILPDKNADFTSMKFDIIDKDENGNSPLIDVIELSPDVKAEALGAIFRYGANYDPRSGQIILAGGPGKTSANYNPAVLAGPTGALVGAYLTQLNTYDMAFSNMDMYMLIPQAQRKAMKLRNRYAINDETTDAVKTDAAKYSSETTAYDTKGMWFKPYTTFENVKLNRGPKVSNIAYGSFFGSDTDVQELKNGFDGIFSLYGAYNGSHQSYKGNSIYQNGGSLGATGMLFKGNFFTALTANAGANSGEASTMYGNENFTMFTTGIASKTGYNWEFAEGKFIIQPSYLMSYSFVNTFDYRNAAGIKINGDPLNVIQISPGVRFIGNLKHGWQPYLGLSMVWNIMDKTKFTANDVSLPDLSLDPYVQYGLGVQQAAGERCTGFLQTMFRSGGRNSVGFQFGFKVAL